MVVKSPRTQSAGCRPHQETETCNRHLVSTIRVLNESLAAILLGTLALTVANPALQLLLPSIASPPSKGTSLFAELPPF